jgi:hypothetical protein
MSEKRTEERVPGLTSSEHDFSKLQSAPTESLTRPFENAYLKYMKAMQVLYDEFQMRSQELYLDYVQVLQEAWTHSDAQQRSEQAYQNYWQAVKQAWESSSFQARLDQAYRDYVEALRAGWAGINPATLDVRSLGTIGYSIVSACWSAERTVQVPSEKESPRS